MSRARLTVAVLSVLTAAHLASGQTIETGFLNRSVILEGTEYRFQVFVPREYRTATQWPVILALHGGGERGSDGLIQTEVGLGRAIRRHAERFPAIVADSGADPFTPVAQRIRQLPIWIFHGDADPTVPVTESRGMAEALQKAGANVQYTELPNVGHNAWDPAYDRADLFDWMFKQVAHRAR